VNTSRNAKRVALGCATLATAAALASPALADQVFHSEHVELAAVGSAPLRSGFVEDIKAEGPRIYAHEIFVLNGALANANYRVTRDFFYQDPQCRGTAPFHDDLTTLSTNAAGNAQADIFVEPGQITGFEGIHGVGWTLHDAAGAAVYRTACVAVTLD